MDGRLRTGVAFDPTLIEIRLLGVTGSSTSGLLEIKSGTVDCTLRTGECASAADHTCLAALPGTSSTELNEPSTQVRRIEMSDGFIGLATCSMRSASAAQVTVQSAGAIEIAPIEITTNLDASTILQSVVVYGAL